MESLRQAAAWLHLLRRPSAPARQGQDLSSPRRSAGQGRGEEGTWGQSQRGGGSTPREVRFARGRGASAPGEGGLGEGSPRFAGQPGLWSAWGRVEHSAQRSVGAKCLERTEAASLRGGDALFEVAVSWPRGPSTPWSSAAPPAAGGWLVERASRPQSRHVEKGAAPAREPEAKGALVRAGRGRLPGGDAPNFLRSRMPTPPFWFLLQPLGPPDAAQRGGRAAGRNPRTPLRTGTCRSRPAPAAGPVTRGLRATRRPGLGTSDPSREAPAKPAAGDAASSPSVAGEAMVEETESAGLRLPASLPGPRASAPGEVQVHPSLP